MCAWDSKSVCFHKIRLFDSKPPESYFMLTFSSIWESLSGPSLLAQCLLVIPVAKAGMFLKAISELDFGVEGDLESRGKAVNFGRCWSMLADVGGRLQRRRPAEGGGSFASELCKD